MGPASTVPAAVDALVAAIRAALPTVQVLDGPAVGTGLQADHVIVAGSLDESSVTGSRSTSAASPPQWSERYDIVVRCASYGAASSTQKAVRDRAFALMDAVHAVLRADQSLGGAVLQAQIGEPLDIDQRPSSATNDKGVEVINGRQTTVTFSVACHGWVT